MEVEGSRKVLQDLVRGAYFFNTNVLGRESKKRERINLFSGWMLTRVASAIKIQKVWRGHHIRQKHEQYMRSLLKMQRAAVILQRWTRKLSLERKK